MKKIAILIIGVFCLTSIYAQVGINTLTPKGWFHVDGKGDTSGAANTSDDVMVDVNGNMAIGTTTPLNKLTIVNSGGVGVTDTGLHLPLGAGAGRVLTSDGSGNATWVSGAEQHQTLVEASSNTQIKIQNTKNLTTMQPIFQKITDFGNVIFDKAALINPGEGNGWSVADQTYKAPSTGVYRVGFSVYFQGFPAQVGENYRAYMHRLPYNSATGSYGVEQQLIQCGIVSVTFTGSDIASYVTGLCQLNKGDKIYLKVASYSQTVHQNDLYYWSGTGHTFLLIESL